MNELDSLLDNFERFFGTETQKIKQPLVNTCTPLLTTDGVDQDTLLKPALRVASEHKKMYRIIDSTVGAWKESDKTASCDFKLGVVKLWPIMPTVLVETHFTMIKAAAAKYHRPQEIDDQLEFDDLISVGREALLAAALKMYRNPEQDFKNLAWQILKQKMLDEQSRKHPIPFKVRKKMTKLMELKADLSEQGKSTSHESLAKKLKMKESEVRELLLLEASWGSGFALDSTEIDDATQVPDHSPDPLGIFIQNEDRSLIAQAMTELSQVQRLIIECVYYKEMSIREAADSLNMSIPLARKNHSKAVHMLKEILEDVGATGV